ncbi:unnamed protein product, partial [Oppiella nova]
MKIILLLGLFYLSVNGLPFSDEPGKTWVVLCAGWKGYQGGGYSIQANVYHAYQVIHAQGIPDENIIVMHYDDLAYHKSNPTPGIVVQKVNGTDVYKGVPKDYTGDEVTPKNFLGVLKGDPELVKKGKRVVNSGPNDNVFVYFIDHGGPDIVSFPRGYLYGEELVAALKDMHQSKRFAKLVFYLEACESGSMFKLLPTDINVYAITSSNATELSWECDWDESRKVYLGGYFAFSWLDDCEHRDLQKESLQEQFDHMKKQLDIPGPDPQKEPHQQHPMQFGDLSITKLPASQFLGYKKVNEKINKEPLDMKMHQAQIETTHEIEYTQELQNLILFREYVDNVFNEYVNSIQHLMPNIATNAILHTKQELNNRHCYRQLVDTFHQNCFNLNQFALFAQTDTGSMFEKLLRNDLNIYVTTSAKPDELSSATYYDILRKTYLGDCYSVALIENSETQDLDIETLQAQFEYISKNVNTSTPQQYGDVSIAKLPVSQFIGYKPTGYIQSKPVYINDGDMEVVNPRDIPVLLAQKNIATTNDINEKQRYVEKLETILKGRKYMDNVLYEYVNSIQHFIPNIATNAILHTKQELNNRHCYRQLVDTFHQNCFNLN